MDFSRELTSFPSAVHKQIFFAARALTPADISLADVRDEKLRASCLAYREFLLCLYSDMYDCPEAYHLPVGELERYLDGRKVNGVKQLYPSKVKTLIAVTRNADARYIALLCMLGREGVPEGDDLLISQEALQRIEKAMNTQTSPIPLDSRLAALTRVGLRLKDGVLAAGRFPGMLHALHALALTAGERTSGFAYFAFCNAEFRNLAKQYKPIYADYYRPLIAPRRELADALHASATRLGFKPAISTFWKVDYKYKGAQVMCVDSLDGDMLIRITGSYAWDDPALIDACLRAESPELQRYALRHVWRCNACSTSHLGMFITVLGKRQRVCGGGVTGFRFDNPGAEDIPNIERLLRIRKEVVDELEKRKKAE